MSKKDMPRPIYRRWGIPREYCDRVELIPEAQAVKAGCQFLKATNLTTVTYTCCLAFHQTTERTAHILTHYTRCSLEDLRDQIKNFAESNMDWIKTVGKDALDALQMDADTYLKAIYQGTIPFDPLAIAITACAFNIHCVIMTADSYWTSRAENKYQDCLIKIAFCGDGVYKELCAAKEDAKTDSANEDSLDSDDLAGTGLVSGEEEDDFDSNNEEQEASNDKAQVQEHSALDLNEGRPADADPDVDRDNSDARESDDSDVVFVGITRPHTPGKHVYRSRKYSCHLCSNQFEMQSSYVDHMKKDHADAKMKCENCPKLFSSPNGLFKHQRSHKYMKCYCDVCPYICQFPYQMKAHRNTHTKDDMVKCEECDKTFASRTSMKIHLQSHTLSIKCDQCPPTKDKAYTSMQSYKLHQRGAHGPGWTAACGKHFKWKSKYARHLSQEDCKSCIKSRAELRLQRFLFLRRMQ